MKQKIAFLIVTILCASSLFGSWIDDIADQITQPFDRDNSNLRSPTSGTIQNIAIFIRFLDQTEFFTPYSTYYDMLNQMDANSNSLRRYFWDTSYQQLDVYSPIFPPPDGNLIVSYQSYHPRYYYQPFNLTTNPSGYTGGANGVERRNREHTLLRDAIVAVRDQIPAELIIDSNDDGFIDNVTFIIRGGTDGFSELLWPHTWTLNSFDVRIHEKTVWTYNIHIENHLNSSGVGVLAHEFAHSLGLPDLIRNNMSGTPIGVWDLMGGYVNPPTSISAHMKARYTDWVPDIPVISESGVYTLHPITTHQNNHAYMINSPNSDTEFFVVEYRSTSTGMLTDTNLPGSGLLIYRVNPTLTGNAHGIPDELYVYRQGGNNTGNGTITTAFYSLESGRTAINSNTSPIPFLSSGADGGINITDIGSAGATISFTVHISHAVQSLTATVDGVNVTLDWTPPHISTGLTGYRISRGTTILATNDSETFSYIDTGLSVGIYTYSVVALYDTLESSPVNAGALVGILNSQIGSGTETHTRTQSGPFNINMRSRRGQFVYTATELNGAGLVGAQEIRGIAFYVENAPLFSLPNFYIRIKHTTAANATSHDPGPFTSTTVISSLTPVTGGWFVMTLAQPFMWNGTQNILFDTAFNLVPAFNTSGVVRIIPEANGYRHIGGDWDSVAFSSTINLAHYKPQLMLYTVAPYPVFAISQSNHNFGNIDIGQISPEQNFIISNTGNAPLIVNSIAKEGIYSDEFNLSATGLLWTIAPGENRDFTVSFSPSSTGFKSIDLNIVHTATNSPFSVSLSGTGVLGATIIDPLEHDFLNVIIGQTSEQTFTITNSGAGSLTIDTISIDGDDHSQFILSDEINLPWVIASAGSRDFTVSFAPTDVGIKNAVVVINDNLPETASNRSEQSVRATHIIPLSGRGVAPPVFSIYPTSHEFEICLIGEISAEQIFTITNTGGSPLSVLSIVFADETENQFSLDFDNLPVDIDPDGSFVFSAVFSPTTIGEKTATITITHIADDSPVEVEITGIAIRPQTIQITPETYHFEGVLSMPFAFSITNIGDLPLIVDEIELSGALAEYFDISFQSVLPNTITDDSMTFLVSFHPTSSGLKTANVIVTSNAASSPHSVVVTGETTISDLDNVVQKQTALLSNYPNPFNPETIIRFTVVSEQRIANSEQKETSKQRVTIDIYNSRGRKVRSLVDGEYATGEHNIVWDGTDDNGSSVGSGVYFYRMSAGDYNETRKMLLIK
jgi:M6 family metalloprotease-like protein